MMNVKENKSSQFAKEFLNDLKTGKIKKEYITSYSHEFSEGMAELHKDRVCTYLKLCGCFLMNRRLDAVEEAYHG